ncbi:MULTISPECIES: type II toxin-antitoxin system HipA family toxin [Mesorhizobium]|uniref:Toxin HipA n=2 Tax=Mesorhizobium TaxID=68287 RepID=A0A1A5HUJ3_RHILI|nr:MULTISPECIES: HipA domain-containing protein [Mesorhizobium]MBE1710253.1 HipA domain-containing protein [Mesorhizobium japonicum]MBE1716897.1 HipA domain-containing protein [Mesorhizobium japonicum]MUT25229.1 type II toxin-antitoxin system HipA family toxin [Mesorhizobium japonicum]MUT28778.1 type II toxin-antitoxin system HipA family toxin [Mesorhizobium japonicum]OBP70390.1 toxin HipA [Mesorhizobium loti]
MSHTQSPKSIHSLDVLLNSRKIGTILRSPAHALKFEQDYRASGGSPFLSLSFRSETGELRKDPKPLAGILPAFFANLLPEGELREAMERHHQDSVRRRNDFDLLAALGADMSGAVQLLPSDRASLNEKPKARFSLAGVQMKLSVLKNAEAGGGLRLPMDGEVGQYIAKFPPMAFPGLSENEFANLALAAAIGMDVPERELVESSDFAGIPEEFVTRAAGKVLLIKRFDRDANSRRIHIEDFAQVFGVHPSRKYEAACHPIAATLNETVGSAAALEFVRRLTLAALTGNGDMHLKNWSLIYKGDGNMPALAPIYDALSTLPYVPTDSMALSLAGERSFRAMAASRWKAFARRARLPEQAVMNAVVETVSLVNERWWHLPERKVVPAEILDRIDAQIKVMTPVLSTCADRGGHC